LLDDLLDDLAGRLDAEALEDRRVEPGLDRTHLVGLAVRDVAPRRVDLMPVVELAVQLAEVVHADIAGMAPLRGEASEPAHARAVLVEVHEPDGVTAEPRHAAKHVGHRLEVDGRGVRVLVIEQLAVEQTDGGHRVSPRPSLA
jgi:hypothetical protein